MDDRTWQLFAKVARPRRQRTGSSKTFPITQPLQRLELEDEGLCSCHPPREPSPTAA